MKETLPRTNHLHGWTLKMEAALCFQNTNNSCRRTIRPSSTRFTLYLIQSAMVFFTVCGNVLVAASIAYFKQLHTPTNFLILSLAVSDLLLGLLVMLPGMIQYVESCWYFGDFFCKVHMGFNFSLCMASIVNLSMIAVDRHYAVCKPLLYARKITVKVVSVVILFCWSVSALKGFGMIFLELNIWGIEDFYYDHIHCEGGCVLFQSGLSSAVSSVLIFYIPGIIMLGIYLNIFLVARRQFRNIRTINSISSRTVPSRSQAKATKTLAVIIGTFFSFTTPFFVCNIIDSFRRFSLPPHLIETLMWLGYLNSSVNPFIYAFFYSWFRKALRLFISGSIFKSDVSETILFTD